MRIAFMRSWSWSARFAVIARASVRPDCFCAEPIAVTVAVAISTSDEGGDHHLDQAETGL